MSDQPLTAGGLRGAVDLTALRNQPPTGPPSSSAQDPSAPGSSAAGSSATSPSATGVAGRTGVVVEGSDANFQEIANASVGVPMLLILWAGQIPESRDYLDTVVSVAGTYDGRFQVVSVNVEQNPTLLRAFQVQSVPMTMGMIQGQPVPMFAGIQPESALRPVLDEFLALAVQHGVTGRVDVSASAPASTAEGDEEVVEQLPPLHQEAYDAIERGDLDAAAAAYQQALKQNPADSEAELGLAQVGLLQRTEGADLHEARAAAADRPTDVAAQALVADLDVLGGHVEDAFLRLIDVVRATSGDEREQARNHLLQLFAVVGSHDERVRKARTALMSALF
jgi:putative thioredoxin